MDPFIGQIIMFAGNYAPRGWAFCDGQLLAVSQHMALFSIIGTFYGGDGRTTFALPDLRGRAPLHAGHGPGLTNRFLGSRAGTETNVLVPSQMPSHTHTLRATSGRALETNPSGKLLAAPHADMYASGTSDVSLNSDAVGTAGGSQPIDNMPPFLAVNYIIALTGIYPSRS